MIHVCMSLFIVLYEVNYLIDEAAQTGKGANTIISLIHHYLETYAFNEQHLHLHAENCGGQNKTG